MHVPTTTSSEPPYTVLGDTQTLQDILSAPSSIRGYQATGLSSSHGSSQSPVLGPNKLHQKESRSKLAALSSHIRKRLSRDTHDSKSSSRKTNSTSHSHDFQPGCHQHSQTSITLDNLLASGPASEGGYDSDAKRIPTPRSPLGLSAGSSCISPEHLNKALQELKKPTSGPPRTKSSVDLNTSASAANTKENPPPVLEDDSASGTKIHETSRRAQRVPTTPQRKSIPTILESGKNERPTDATMVESTSSATLLNPPLPPNLELLRLPRITDGVVRKEWRLSLAPPRRVSSLHQTEPQPASPITRSSRDQSALQPFLDYWRQSREHSPVKTSNEEFSALLVATSDAVTKTQAPLHLTAVTRSIEENRASLSSVSSNFDWGVQTLLNYWRQSPDERDINKSDPIEAPTPTPPLAPPGGPPAPANQSVSERNSKSRHSSAPTHQFSDVDNNSIHLFNMGISQRLASRSQMPVLSPSGSVSEPMHEGNKASFGTLATFPSHGQSLDQNTDAQFQDGGKLHPTWSSKIRDDTSSCYVSRPASPSSSQHGSFLQVPPNVGRQARRSSGDSSSFQRFGGRLRANDRNDSNLSSVNESAWLRRNTFDDHRSSTESFRARELAAADARFPTKAGSVSEPKISRFKEDFGGETLDIGSSSASALDLRAQTEGRKDSGATRSTSDGWLSGGRRQGFGYSLVEKPQEDGASLWERALRTHRQSRERSIRQSFGSSIWKRPSWTKGRGVSPKDSKRSLRPSTGGSKLNVITNPLPRHHGSVSPSFVSHMGENATYGHTPKPKRSFPSWAKFPRHTRAERSGNAGAMEHVAVRDFSRPQRMRVMFVNDGECSHGESGKKQKQKPNRSMTLGQRGKNIFKNWKTLYRSQSTDLRRLRKGHRSSISKGGLLEFPELEIIPGGPGLYRDMNNFGHKLDANEEYSRNWAPEQIKKHLNTARDTEATEEWSPTLQPTGDNIPVDSAQGWSQLYEDCVGLPRSSTEEGEMVLVSRQVSPKDEELDHCDFKDEDEDDSKANRHAADTDLRSSTMNFTEALLREEKQTRERLLQQASGTARSAGFDGNNDTQAHKRQDEVEIQCNSGEIFNVVPEEPFEEVKRLEEEERLVEEKPFEEAEAADPNVCDSSIYESVQEVLELERPEAKGIDQ